MCNEVHRNWYGKSWDFNELADVMYRNLDFCIDYRWPSKETLKELIPINARHENGIVIDEEWSLLNNTFALIIGDSKSNVRYNAFNVGKIYVFDNSKCNITVKGHAFLIIHLFDNANVNVTVNDNAKASIVLHSELCSYCSTGSVTIKESIS